MQQIIAINLHSPQDSHFEWVILDQNYQPLGEVQSGDIHHFISETRDKIIIGVLADPKVTLIEHELPPVKTEQRAQIAAYAVEELIAESLEHLHFAVNDKAIDDKYLISWLAQETMQQWQTFFDQHDITITTLVPAVLLLPYHDDSWTVIIENKNVLIRTSAAHGFYTTRDQLVHLLKIKLNEHPKKITHIDLYSEKTENIRLEHIEVSSHQLNQSILSLYNFKDIAINLLQGDYKPKANWQRYLKYWKKPIILTSAGLAILLVSNLIQLGLLHYHYNKQSDITLTIYEQLFPDAPRGIDPILVFQREIENLESQQVDLSLYELLDKISVVQSRATTGEIKNIAYRDQQLTILVDTANFTELQEFTDIFKELNIDIVSQESNNTGSIINTQITIN